MISENFSIDEFVEAVKDREILDVVSLAVDEATEAERNYYRGHRRQPDLSSDSRDYSIELKQLIDYLRFEIKPKRPNDKAYRLYVAHWGTT